MLELEAERARIGKGQEGNNIIGGGQDHGEEEEDKEKKKDDGKLDMLNLYVKELRQPTYQTVPGDRKSSSPKPNIDYTRVYLPNGQ